MRIVIALGLVVALHATAWAHVVVLPARSQAGNVERYTVVVPTEGDSATIRVELRVPMGVEVAALEAKPGWQGSNQPFPIGAATVQWSGGRIPPGEMVSFELLVMNPPQPRVLTWNATQWYENGGSDRWGEGAPADHEASTTTLIAASDAPATDGAVDAHGGGATVAPPPSNAGAEAVSAARASAALWIALMALAVAILALLLTAAAGRRGARARS